ncbi:MAG: cryptochrome/photolyase family protein, partial [Cyclobacteriaceae bacterium]|nr:cryptochrome/photolyase family protein [Cyclobacteriaceae bacterium]
GLLTPGEIVEAVLKYSAKHAIPINSLEGFLRQLIGWREFIRGVYGAKGSFQRTKNYWNFDRPIPKSFYDGTTGIEPVDTTIRKVLKTGYCHHIERLMVLGNFMFLCGFHPNAVYRWFMELFIDAYDWVMVPNIYGMSQFADGGLMATKPYISGSNYILKMSNYKKGDWCEIWDGLYWMFIYKHQKDLARNPRMSMMVRQLQKMDPDRFARLRNKKEQFLAHLGI